MKNRTWYVVNAKDKDGGFYAYPVSVPNNENLVDIFRHENILTVNACDTKRDAVEIAKVWNESYVVNGTAADFLIPAKSMASA